MTSANGGMGGRAARWTLRTLCLVALATAAGRAGAEDMIALGTVTAPPGMHDVAVPVTATTSTPLTGLSLDITFDKALCAAIRDERLEPAGRVTAAPLEGGTRCPDEGRVSIVLFDLTGEAVVPAGSGPVAQWIFSIKDDAATNTSPLELTVVAARNGFDSIELPASRGSLTIGAATCAGDCNGDGTVAINELISGVNIALGSAVVSSCSSFDVNGDGMVSINELIAAVNHALNGC